MLNKSTLVLEGVTLGEMVEFVVKVLVDLAGGTVSHKKAAENSLATHPQNLALRMSISVILLCSIRPHRVPFFVARGNVICIPGHTSVCGTLPLTKTTVSADSSCCGELTGASTRMHGNGFLNDEAIADELADSLAGVGAADF